MNRDYLINAQYCDSKTDPAGIHEQCNGLVAAVYCSGRKCGHFKSNLFLVRGSCSVHAEGKFRRNREERGYAVISVTNYTIE